MISPEKALQRAQKNQLKLQEVIEAAIDEDLANRMTLAGCRVVLADELRHPIAVNKVIAKYRENGWNVELTNPQVSAYDFTFRVGVQGK